jgi:ubiquinone/menaquinone biosynthesis C-methylase UbiE
MDRTQWRKERRLWNEVQTDIMYARQYDQHRGSSINSSHRDMLERFLDLCPNGGSILDVACGTGRYWPMLLARGFSVYGTDQSQQMLRQAQARFPGVPVEHVGMQELSFLCISGNKIVGRRKCNLLLSYHRGRLI